MKKLLLLLVWILPLMSFAQTQTFVNNDDAGFIEEDGKYHYSDIYTSDVGVISDLHGLEKVCVRIESDEDGQLSICLKAPDGTLVLLSSHNGGNGDDYGDDYDYTCFTMNATKSITEGTVPFYGDFLPEEDLSKVNNFQNAGYGVWALGIKDDNGDDESNVRLIEWKLIFNDHVKAPITRITSCDTVFYDLGGPSADYSPDECHYWVICPEDTTKNVGLFFEQWDVEDGLMDDHLTFWNDTGIAHKIYFDALGSDATSLDSVLIKADNSTGCLTLRWVSDSDTIVRAGWKAKISCYDACQEVKYAWDGSIPANDSAGFIATCLDSAVTFSAHGIYPQNDSLYHQSDATSRFIWNFGDGTYASGTTVQHKYNKEKGYTVNLKVIDTMGCASSLYLDKRVKVSISPTFNITPEEIYLHKGDSTLLIQQTQMHGYTKVQQYFCYADSLVSSYCIGCGDGGRYHYYPYFPSFDRFKEGAEISDSSQIDSIAINIEHTWVGDLLVWIVCPNGQEALLFDGNDTYPSNWLGQPGSDDGDPDYPGIGWDYVFSETADVKFKDADLVDITTLDGTDGRTVVSGTYKPMGRFKDLVGCPLNGIWSIKVKDDQSSDNGYFFYWKMWVDSSLYQYQPWGYEMQATDSFWVSLDSSRIDTTVSPVKVFADKVGENHFKYTLVDQFGCSHDTTIVVVGSNVNFELSAEATLCHGDSSGKVHLTVTDGTVSKYSWEKPNGTTGSEESTETTKTWTGLTAGTFTVTVEDADGNPLVKSIEISEPTALALSESHTNVQCHGGQDGRIDLSVSGGTPDYTYLWNTGDTTEDIADLAAGKYVVTIQDAHGCELQSDSISVSEPAALAISFSIDSSSCGQSDGAIFTTVSGGTPSYSYLWNDSTTTANRHDLDAGNYILTVEDNHHCVKVDTAVIPYANPPEQSICMVTVDTVTNTNLVVWERNNDSLVAYYNVYRQDTASSDYLLIASVAVNELSEYYDTTANPNERAWYYKLSEVDSCGNESVLSQEHKTIHLEMEEDGDIFNLNWDSYEGTTYTMVYVYRKIGDGAWDLQDSLSSDVYSYSDTLSTSESVYYIVVIRSETACEATSRGLRSRGSAYAEIISNEVGRSAITSTNELNVIKRSIHIYPNPTKGQFVVQGYQMQRIEVTTASGQIVREIRVNTSKIQLDLSKESAGLYFVKIITKYGVVTKKLILK